VSTPQSVRILVGILAVSGTIHLVRPETYERTMPSFVSAHREVILGSGVAELVLAAGLLAPPTRRLAGWGSVGLLLAVFPANLKMAADATRSDNAGFRAAAFGRLPLQVPMVRMALKAARG